jgi:hypothetical protein
MKIDLEAIIFRWNVIQGRIAPVAWFAFSGLYFIAFVVSLVNPSDNAFMITPALLVIGLALLVPAFAMHENLKLIASGQGTAIARWRAVLAVQVNYFLMLFSAFCLFIWAAITSAPSSTQSILVATGAVALLLSLLTSVIFLPRRSFDRQSLPDIKIPRYKYSLWRGWHNPDIPTAEQFSRWASRMVGFGPFWCIIVSFFAWIEADIGWGWLGFESWHLFVVSGWLMLIGIPTTVYETIVVARSMPPDKPDDIAERALKEP